MNPTTIASPAFLVIRRMKDYMMKRRNRTASPAPVLSASILLERKSEATYERFEVEKEKRRQSNVALTF
jgi:hypothetical protein